MPCDNRDRESAHNYISYVAILSDIIYQSDADGFILVGDFNADHQKESKFWKELLVLLQEHDLFHITSTLTSNDFTYLCPASNNTSFLDHVICTKNLIGDISNIKIGYEYCLYDHFPVLFSVDICSIKDNVTQREMPS